jgi:hypothetical protein
LGVEKAAFAAFFYFRNKILGYALAKDGLILNHFLCKMKALMEHIRNSGAIPWQ